MYLIEYLSHWETYVYGYYVPRDFKVDFSSLNCTWKITRELAVLEYWCNVVSAIYAYQKIDHCILCQLQFPRVSQMQM